MDSRLSRRDLFPGGLALMGAPILGAGFANSASAAEAPRATRAGTQGRGTGGDLAIINANIVTLESGRPRAQAALVRNGRISLVGDNAAVLGARGSAPVFDAGRKTIVPGFYDGHVHMELTAQYHAYMVDAHVPPVQSLKEILGLLKKKAGETPQGRWVVGRAGYNLANSVPEKRLATRREMDAVSEQHPVILFSGLHVAMLNTAALKALKLWDRKEAESLKWRNGALRTGSTIHRDAEDTPTGIVTEIADLYYEAKPFTIDEIKASIVKFADSIFVSKGITSIISIPKATYDIRAAQQLSAEDNLPMRMRYYIHTPLTIDMDALLDSGLAAGFGNDMLRFGGIKIFVDGTGGDGLGKEFDDLKWTSEALTETVGKAHAEGFQVIQHCVTRKGYDMAVAAVAAAQAKQRKDLRHRIEHVGYITDPADIKKLVDLGMRVTMTRAAPADRAPRRSASWRTMADLGLEPLAVSDSTGTEPEFSPWWGVASLMTTPENGGAVTPDQVLTFEQALSTYTLWTARAMHEDRVKGSIAVGKFGDFAVLSADPATAKGKSIFDIKVTTTILGGKIVYGET